MSYNYDNNGWYCDYCGDYIGQGRKDTANAVPPPPYNAVTQRYNLIMMRVFCSQRCKEDFKRSRE